MVVICLKAAFESDHIKREVGLAGLLPASASRRSSSSGQWPRDFEYFFAGVQSSACSKPPKPSAPPRWRKPLEPPHVCLAADPVRLDVSREGVAIITLNWPDSRRLTNWSSRS
ncbi:MAG: hypothetical protein R3C16_01945 [Hyphomonadaceae bacterium]